MDENQAQQLAKLIKREAPHLSISLAPVEAVGWKAWAVYIDATGFNEPLPIENPKEWEIQKSAFLLP
jgi:hypothetical protein